MAKLKTICKWSPKEIEKRYDYLVSLMDEPTYMCKKCARCSNKKKALCKPAPLPVKATW